MQVTGKITRDSLMTLEAYSKYRKQHKADIIAHRKLRSVGLGEHMTLQFEDERTIRRQIQEMLHIEKIFDEAGILGEIEAYAPLVPDGSNWKATMLIEYPDPHERKRELSRLIGVEDRMFVEVEGHARIYAIADEDLERETAEKTSSVHFLRFEFPSAAREAVRAGAQVKLGCDHTNYPAHVVIPAESLASLAGDVGVSGHTARAWLGLLEARHGQAIQLGLDRVRAVRDALDLPQTCPVFTIGGTNGKGSTCALLEAVLLASGYRVGLYTSPHLLKYNERVRIDGRDASDEALVEAFAEVERARGDVPLTYFEHGTLAAWVAFSHARLDAIILEVGLGGRLDAVNVFEPDCAIVTSAFTPTLLRAYSSSDVR